MRACEATEDKKRIQLETVQRLGLRCRLFSEISPGSFSVRRKALPFGELVLFICIFVLCLSFRMCSHLFYNIYSEVYSAITLSFLLDSYFFTLPHSQSTFWRAGPFSCLGASHSARNRIGPRFLPALLAVARAPSLEPNGFTVGSPNTPCA